MRNTIIILMMGLLLIGVNAFAQGNLEVKGNAKVEKGVDAAASISDTGLFVDGRFVTLWSPSVAAFNQLVGVTGFNAINSTSFTANSFAKGLSFKNTSQSGSASGDITNLTTWGLEVFGFSPAGGGTFSSETIYGADITAVLNLGFGGAVTTNNTYGLYLRAPDANGTLTINTTNAGIWIENMNKYNPAGSSTVYGIVLDGDGVGSDIVFKPSIPAEKTRLYSNAGRLYAHDSFGNATILSPHDPETGEWIYYSRNVKTGKTVRVDMERLVKAVEKITGETFMIETLSE